MEEAMTDLVGWLRPLIEARKVTAEAAASSGAWDAPGSPVWRTRSDESDRYLVQDSNGDVVVYDEGAPTEEQAAHMALNDPRQIIADCDADLAILDEHRQVTFTDLTLGIDDAQVCTVCHARLDEPDDFEGDDWTYPLVQVPFPCHTVRLIAWAYRFRDPAGYAEVAKDWTP